MIKPYDGEKLMERLEQKIVTDQGEADQRCTSLRGLQGG